MDKVTELIRVQRETGLINTDWIQSSSGSGFSQVCCLFDVCDVLAFLCSHISPISHSKIHTQTHTLKRGLTDSPISAEPGIDVACFFQKNLAGPKKQQYLWHIFKLETKH